MINGKLALVNSTKNLLTQPPTSIGSEMFHILMKKSGWLTFNTQPERLESKVQYLGKEAILVNMPY